MELVYLVGGYGASVSSRDMELVYLVRVWSQCMQGYGASVSSRGICSQCIQYGDMELVYLVAGYGASVSRRGYGASVSSRGIWSQCIQQGDVELVYAGINVNSSIIPVVYSSGQYSTQRFTIIYSISILIHVYYIMLDRVFLKMCIISL